LLNQAVEEIRTGRPAIEAGPVTLDLPLTALIPGDYINDTELRLRTYSQLASCTSLQELEDVSDELRDRFGDYPMEVEHLLALIGLRIRASGFGIESLVEREREIVIRPIVTAHLDARRISSRFGDAVKITRSSVRIRLLDLKEPWQDVLGFVLDEVERVRASLETRAAD
jgi:transcription-repair coupling factor (superfamily II helicase)